MQHTILPPQKRIHTCHPRHEQANAHEAGWSELRSIMKDIELQLRRGVPTYSCTDIRGIEGSVMLVMKWTDTFPFRYYDMSHCLESIIAFAQELGHAVKDGSKITAVGACAVLTASVEFLQEAGGPETIGAIRRFERFAPDAVQLLRNSSRMESLEKELENEITRCRYNHDKVMVRERFLKTQMEQPEIRAELMSHPLIPAMLSPAAKWCFDEGRALLQEKRALDVQIRRIEAIRDSLRFLQEDDSRLRRHIAQSLPDSDDFRIRLFSGLPPLQLPPDPDLPLCDFLHPRTIFPDLPDLDESEIQWSLPDLFSGESPSPSTK